MARSRLELHKLLEDILGSSNVYFQPPEGFRLKYPCIVYNRSTSRSNSASNAPYRVDKRYSVTLIVRDPDSDLPDKLEWLPQSIFERFFTKDQLNHYIFNILY